MAGRGTLPAEDDAARLDDGAEDIAEDVDRPEMLRRDFVDHVVELAHVHRVDGGADAALHIQLIEERGSVPQGFGV